MQVLKRSESGSELKSRFKGNYIPQAYSFSCVYTPCFPLIFMFKRRKCRGANVGGVTVVGASARGAKGKA